ncbi:MAG: diaminopropionate ammonia-lyase [Proteobacteria bacterium]|nr:diaminopropionate ammonia-lyase [Pseudomonadota bacterium]
MLMTNPRAVRTAYPDDLKALLNLAQAQQSRRWLAGWDGLTPGATPLRDLPGLARQLGVARLAVKDESVRSPLGSFKALGAPIALVRQLLRLHPGFDPARLLAGAYGEALQGYTAISATDGNHGRGLAAACRSVGCRCVIVLHAQVSAEREAAIAAYGAQIVRIAGDYDASVEEAARLARANGWQVISDTSYAGYEDIPRDVMQGYAILALEVAEQTAGQPPFTHVIVQGGVGGLAAGLFSALWEQQGAARPHLLVVEPRQADCLLQSAIQGRPARATGSVDSVMAGLACGETSPLAWRFLQPSVDAFMTIEDAQAVQAMQTLAAGGAGDIPIVAGESGAAGLAALQALHADPAAAQATHLDGHARVLLINTEGATAPAVYRELVGESAQAVRQRQAAWSSQ